jgi:hypothetical protein
VDGFSRCDSRGVVNRTNWRANFRDCVADFFGIWLGLFVQGARRTKRLILSLPNLLPLNWYPIARLKSRPEIEVLNSMLYVNVTAEQAACVSNGTSW